MTQKIKIIKGSTAYVLNGIPESEIESVRKERENYWFSRLILNEKLLKAYRNNDKGEVFGLNEEIKELGKERFDNSISFLSKHYAEYDKAGRSEFVWESDTLYKVMKNYPSPFGDEWWGFDNLRGAILSYNPPFKEKSESNDYKWTPIRCTTLSIIKEKMNIEENSILYDLGSGDGRVPIVCGETCKKTYGIELNQNLHLTAVDFKENYENLIGKTNTTLINGNFFNVNYSDATHIFMSLTYLEKESNKISKLLKPIKEGSMVISVSWPLNNDYFEIIESNYYCLDDTADPMIFFFQERR